ncbi:ABC transporter substrate-binding protein [Bradyrhizobium sp.]|uniref:ABC transporter substrate-binding protein n=1 Tax=Bradyrhizobium sp. TaxID=376 RepID=UPI003C5DF265
MKEVAIRDGFNRRRFLAAAGAGSILALSGVQVRAEPGGQLVVSNWGGDWNDRTMKLMEQPLVEAKGIHIVRDLGMEPERKSKLLAEQRLPRGTVDVIHLNDSDAFEMKSYDAVSEIDFSKMSNANDIIAPLHKPYFVPWLYSGVVLIYNKDKLKDPPSSYRDLWDPQFAGRIGLTNQLYFNYMMIASLLASGNLTSVDAGRARLAELREKSNPRIYATHQQMQAGLASGEVDVVLNYKARGLQWAKDGLPLTIAYPDEGAIAITFGACMSKKAPNKEAAYYYLNAMIDRNAMANLSAASFYAPANGAAELPPDLRAKIDFSEAERAKLRFPDYGYVAKNTAEWLEWWNKNVARA